MPLSGGAAAAQPSRRAQAGRRALLLLPLAIAGCDQMRLEPVAELPPEVLRGAGDPARFAAETAAHAFLARERELWGNPGDAAFAAAMVENASTAFQDAGRFADGPWVTRLLREGRAALRGAIGLDLALPPPQVQDALLAAAAAFRRGDTAAASAALAPVASRGARPAEALARLETPQPLRRALRETREMLRRALISDGR
jgi:hypothetical protein